MKKTDQAVFTLVKSLESAEKKAFLRFASSTTRQDPVFLKLFELLDQAAVYEEEGLKRALKVPQSSRSFTVSKRYLEDHLKAHLHTAHLRAAPEREAQSELDLVSIFIKKQEATLVVKSLKRAKKLIVQYQLAHLEARYWESVQAAFRAGMETKRSSGRAREIAQQIQTAHRHALAHSKVTAWSMELTELHYEVVQSRAIHDTRLEELMGDAPDPDSLHSAAAKLEALRGWAIYHHMTSDPVAACRYNLRALAMLESDRHLKQRFAAEIISLHSNLLIDAFNIEDNELMDDQLLRFKALPQQSVFKSFKGLEARIFRQTSMLELNRAIRAHTFQKGWALRPQVTEGLQLFKKQISKPQRMVFHYLLALCGGLADQRIIVEEALSEINAAIPRSSPPAVKEIIRAARVWNLLIHARLDNLQLLDSLLPGTRRYLHSKQRLSEPEKLLFSKLKAWLDSPINTRKQILKDWLSSIQKTSKMQVRFYQLLPVENWIEKQLDSKL